MADAVTTVSGKFYSTGIKVVTVNMVCATAASAFTSAVLAGEQGKELVSVMTKAGGTGPTADSDLTITDGTTGRNLVATNGADSVDNSGTNHVAPDATAYVAGPLTVAVANNSVNNAETTIYLVFKAKY